MTTPFTPFGINFGTAAQVKAYPGRADLPAQPVWATDTHQLWIVDGTAGKYELAKMSDLGPYLKSADAERTYLKTTNATKDYAPISHKHEIAHINGLSNALSSKLSTSELETALKELIVEFGGQVPA